VLAWLLTRFSLVEVAGLILILILTGFPLLLHEGIVALSGHDSPASTAANRRSAVGQ
jgi:hypothetical protein